MKGSYLWNVGGIISEIRLIIEGAVTLYEEDASGINKMMMDAGNLTAAAGFDTIGEALYELLTHFRSMKEAHTKEVVRLLRKKPSRQNKHPFSLTENQGRKNAGIGSKTG